MPRYATDTDVTAEKSRAEIERTLRRYGADAFGYAWSGDRAMIEFAMNGRRIRFYIPMPDRAAEEFTHYRHSSGKSVERSVDAADKLYEQATRQRWRALALVVKAKLEAVDAGVTGFEVEFLAHIVLPSGGTVAETALPAVERAYATGEVPALLPG